MSRTPENADRPAPPEPRLLLVGARRQVRRLANCLDHAPWSSLPIVGYVDLSGRGRQLVVHPGSEPVPILGRVDRIAELVDRSGATDLVVALAGRPAVRLRPQLANLSDSAVRVHWVDDEHPRGQGPLPHAVGGRKAAPLPFAIRIGRLAKRALDVLASGLGLLMLAPLFALVAALIKLSDGGPVFYTQERIGQGGRPFRIIKFRSMRVDAESQTGPIWATFHDTRCTRVGDWLRDTNIDELPQLLNVLKGDMSLVGPRPERPVFVDKFTSELPDYEYRHAVPAGMTGWAQVHGWRGRTSLRKRVQYDLDYIRRWSFGLDIRILFMTIQHVVWGKTQWKGAGPRPFALRMRPRSRRMAR